jgi:hypothetical protein
MVTVKLKTVRKGDNQKGDEAKRGNEIATDKYQIIRTHGKTTGMRKQTLIYV